MDVMPEQKRRGRKRASGHTRRQIIKLTGATAALSGITANSQATSGFATGDQDDDSGTTPRVAGGHANNEGSLQWSGGDADPNDGGSSESDFQNGPGIITIINNLLKNNTHIAQWLNPLIASLMLLVTYFYKKMERDEA
jgi:hypothetical protein